jgi:SAM-dependent methyltransferase
VEKVTWTHPGIAHILDAVPLAAKSLLDVGCGTGIMGALCRIYRDMERQVGMDGYAPALALCRRHDFYDETLERDFAAGPLPFDDASFDVVTCVEVIEHLERDAGLRLLAELERVGRLVIVTTPNGFLEQGELAQNPLQRHRSGWTVADFRRRGYRVTGVGAMLVLGKHRRFVSAAFGPLTRVLPTLSELILAVRAAAPTTVTGTAHRSGAQSPPR